MKEKTAIAKKTVRDMDREDRINRALSKLKHKDLQRECIVRGLEFQKIIEFDHHELANWFYHNFEKPEQLEKLVLYDHWMEEQLQQRGYKKGDAILSPAFRFSFVPSMDDIPKISTPGVGTARVKGGEGENKSNELKPEKQKRVVDETTGVYSGTKKNLTYTLTDQGLPLKEIIEKVKEVFEDAQEKSIKIWHKRRLDEKK